MEGSRCRGSWNLRWVGRVGHVGYVLQQYRSFAFSKSRNLNNPPPRYDNKLVGLFEFERVNSKSDSSFDTHHCIFFVFRGV